MGIETAIIAGAAVTAASTAYSAHSASEAADEQSDAAKEAARTEAQGSEAALAELARQYESSSAQSSPYISAGQNALSKLTGSTQEQIDYDEWVSSLKSELSDLQTKRDQTSYGTGMTTKEYIQQVADEAKASGDTNKYYAIKAALQEAGYVGGTEEESAATQEALRKVATEYGWSEGIGGKPYSTQYDSRIEEIQGILSSSERPEGTSEIRSDLSEYIRDNSGLLQDRTGLLQDRSGLLQDRSGILQDRSGVLRDNSGMITDFTAEDFQTDPGYEFRLSEGAKALERAASGGGYLYSGRSLKDLSDYIQGTASDEYQNAYERFNTDQEKRYNAANYSDEQQYEALTSQDQRLYDALTGQDKTLYDALTDQDSRLYSALSSYDQSLYNAANTWDQNQYNAKYNSQNDYYNQLLDIAKMGLSATTSQSSSGSDYAQQVANLYSSSSSNQANYQLASGQAQAEGTQSSADTVSSGISDAYSIWKDYNTSKQNSEYQASLLKALENQK